MYTKGPNESYLKFLFTNLKVVQTKFLAMKILKLCCISSRDLNFAAGHQIKWESNQLETWSVSSI